MASRGYGVRQHSVAARMMPHRDSTSLPILFATGRDEARNAQRHGFAICSNPEWFSLLKEEHVFLSATPCRLAVPTPASHAASATVLPTRLSHIHRVSAQEGSLRTGGPFFFVALNKKGLSRRPFARCPLYFAKPHSQGRMVSAAGTAPGAEGARIDVCRSGCMTAVPLIQLCRLSTSQSVAGLH